MRFSEDQVGAVLANLQMPVVLVVGNDLQTSAKLAKRAVLVSQLQWLRLDGDHHLHMENQVSVCAQALVELSAQCINKEA